MPRLCICRATRQLKAGASMTTATAGRFSSAARISFRKSPRILGRWLRISVMPTTARSFASTMISHPAARMRSPPAPKNSSCRACVVAGLCPAGTGRSPVSTQAEMDARRRRASISCAPYISPEASPAEMRTCTGHIVTGSMDQRSVVRVRGDRGSPGRHLLILILQLVELVVNSALGQQLLVRSHFADLPFVHHDDLVGTLDGRQPVRDDQRRSPFHHVVERVAHTELGLRVHT